MNYLIIGAGGTGGSIAAFMTEAGKDVTVIARGEHLKAILQSGLKMEATRRGNYTVYPVKAFDMEHYCGQPDVIFVCVKSYSIMDTLPFIRKIAKKDTVVIPLLNIYGTGKKMQEQLPQILVTDGCIYIAAEIKEPGIIWQNGDIFRIVYGVRNPSECRSVLRQVEADLKDSGIDCIVSDNIQRDALQKFSYVSPMAACGAYFDVNAGAIQKDGEIRDTFIDLVREVDSLAQGMGIHFAGDIVDRNLKILDALSVTASTSMQRDIKTGSNSEIDGLLFEVVRMGRKLGISVPCYEKIARHFGYIDML
jgi:2-dehydropantoate 2-reductase